MDSDVLGLFLQLTHKCSKVVPVSLIETERERGRERENTAILASDNYNTAILVTMIDISNAIAVRSLPDKQKHKNPSYQQLH